MALNLLESLHNQRAMDTPLLGQAPTAALLIRTALITISIDRFFNTIVFNTNASIGEDVPRNWGDAVFAALLSPTGGCAHEKDQTSHLPL